MSAISNKQIRLGIAVKLEDISTSAIKVISRVGVAGNFNSWNYAKTPLIRIDPATWHVFVDIQANMQYKFKIVVQHEGMSDWVIPISYFKHPWFQIVRDPLESGYVENCAIKVPTVYCGKPYPYGVSTLSNGLMTYYNLADAMSTQQEALLNFSVYAKCTKAILCIFETATSDMPIMEFEMSHTGNVWHIALNRAAASLASLYYAYKIQNEKKFTYAGDPYSVHPRSTRSLSGWGVKSEKPSIWYMTPIPKLDGVFTKFGLPFFDWEGDLPPRIPQEKLVIYEVHVRGFTMDEKMLTRHQIAGTYLGLAAKAPYLAEMGFNCVELLPVFEYDESNCVAGEGKLTNYWGYNTVSFFAPMKRFATDGGDPIREFKFMVKELHRHGIEVMLDVVYNHVDMDAAPFGILADDSYFIMEGKKWHTNFTGCGNTVACNFPVTRQHIVDSLKYWVAEMHIDGFRFDLASVFCRHWHAGHPLDLPPVVEEISLDPVLSQTKLIAEPWDCGGLYKVGSFPYGERWMEWNDRFRDTVRKFLKGDYWTAEDFAMRLSGSPDLYMHWPRGSPQFSLNFITAHDGFTMRDLVSYNWKKNEANAEGNRDGNDNNMSWNCGVEGVADPVTQKDICSLRMRQIKNCFLIMALARGAPMFRSGDEYGHTCHGNNNPWNQDNSMNYFQWEEAYTGDGLILRTFLQKALRLRTRVQSLTATTFEQEANMRYYTAGGDRLAWSVHSDPAPAEELETDPMPSYYIVRHEDGKPGFNEFPFVAFTVACVKHHVCIGALYVAFNARGDAVDVSPPHKIEFKGKEEVEIYEPDTWYRVVDTNLESPADFIEHAYIVRRSRTASAVVVEDDVEELVEYVGDAGVLPLEVHSPVSLDVDSVAAEVSKAPPPVFSAPSSPVPAGAAERKEPPAVFPYKMFHHSAVIFTTGLVC